jgi:predicted nucleic acid-binding Zn ribbon protein
MPLDAIGRVINQLEKQPSWRSRGQFRQILDHWPALVGPAVARQAEPIRLTGSILYVAVTNPMWAQTLTLERFNLLTKLNQKLHLGLSDLRFSSGDWYRRSPTSPTPAQNSLETLPEWLRQHPSFEPHAISASPQTNPKPTPIESFQRWATLAQDMAAQRALCPICRCPTPSGELKRWSCCSICVAKRFSHNGQGQGHREPPPPWNPPTQKSPSPPGH